MLEAKVKGKCDDVWLSASLTDGRTYEGSSYECARSSSNDEMSSKRPKYQPKRLSGLHDVR